MEKKTCEVMDFLLRNRSRFSTEAEFRTYLLESARELSVGLRDFGVEIWVRPASARSAPEKRTDWNYLKMGCE